MNNRIEMKTIIFDIGKVIVPFDADRFLTRLEEFGKLKKEAIRELVYASEELKLCETGKISSRDFYEIVRENLGLELSYLKFRATWCTIFDPETILPDELIANLAKKYRLIVLSDTCEIHFKFLKKNYPIFRHFDDFILSYKVGTMKPSREIYEIAVKKAKCEPHECFFVDDKLDNVEGAKEFGIEAAQFLSAKQFKDELKMRKII